MPFEFSRHNLNISFSMKTSLILPMFLFHIWFKHLFLIIFMFLTLSPLAYVLPKVKDSTFHPVTPQNDPSKVKLMPLTMEYVLTFSIHGSWQGSGRRVEEKYRILRSCELLDSFFPSLFLKYSGSHWKPFYMGMWGRDLWMPPPSAVISSHSKTMKSFSIVTCVHPIPESPK